MAITYTWTIPTVERTLSDGGGGGGSGRFGKGGNGAAGIVLVCYWN